MAQETDFRALCAELVEDLALWLEYDGPPSRLPQEEDESYQLLKRARAALAQGPTPADGEVAELVSDLRQQANYGFSEFVSRDKLLRAADLLAQRYPQPVPVSERLPGAVKELAQPGSQAEMLAVRPMMEQIAAMGDCIGQQTVGQIMAISQRAAAWLAENPPGQPVAIEPRGCPTPGACSCVMPSTSTALAQPEPEGPTDQELMEAFDGEFAEFFDSLDGFGTTAIPRSEWIKVARAVLTRWGRPAPQPVPVSERLPGPEDCDAEGRCWWGRAESDDWSADWTFATHESIAEFCEFTPRTVWLPAHDLPLPGEVEHG